MKKSWAGVGTTDLLPDVLELLDAFRDSLQAAFDLACGKREKRRGRANSFAGAPER